MAKPGSHLDLRSDRAGRHNDVRGSEEMSTQPQTDVPAAYPEGAARSPLPFFSRLLTEVIRTGRLTVIDATGRVHPFGPGDSGPDVTVRLCDPLLPLRILLRPSLALGEAYMDGTISIEKGTLRDLLHLCTSNLEALDQHPIGALRGELDRLLRRLQQDNRLARARANIAHHYDLSGALYDLFLDRDRQYSCAYFQTGAESLEDAQEKKKHHIMAKLLLEPGMRVLDVGSGWGGLALEMAQTAGADVTGLTLSQEQLAVATERAVTAGLSSRVRFVMRDYREDQGTYDRIVSVGMFEHVGVAHYRTYFDTLRQRLNPEGIALVHAIGRADPPGSTDPWLRKYIFPGGYCPALSEVLAAVERSGLWVTDIEILRLHYAETLRHWFERFQANRDRAKAIYDERFCRMWEFYLAACEAAFRNGPMMVFQLQLARRRDAVPLTRDYITDWERRDVRAEDVAP
ncbi:SAM-dependent methyltransferase [Acuticoccus sediminis]|nr:cyclopropane-fatty-acyl-phospholipid synthase family protein [Acuticoccus sediminis]